MQTDWLRDALGRVVKETRSDGRVLEMVYDRTGGAIQTRTGSGTTTSSSRDSRGLEIARFLPNGRGNKLMSYGFDGRPLVSDSANESGTPWRMSYAYDTTGRVITSTHADGTSESYTYNLDSTVATRTTREGVLVTYAYDPANRVLSAVPTAGSLPGSLVALDAGDAFTWDELSRRTSSRRGRDLLAGGATGTTDPALTVAYPSFDLESRPESEVVGNRPAMSWQYDTWNRPTQMLLPGGYGGGLAGFNGFDRSYDTLDRLFDVSASGAQPAANNLGATWTWGGRDRLWAMDTKGFAQTAARFTYINGPGTQPPGSNPSDASNWRLGTLTWGSGGGAAATSAPTETWGSFGFGWRGTETSDGDALKLGREVLGVADIFRGQGYSIGYDAAERVASGIPGDGDVTGSAPAGAEGFGYSYGLGDELLTSVDEFAGTNNAYTSGATGRITSRDGVPFTYDEVGRRTSDDRHDLFWNWRSETAVVNVKAGTGSAYEGHQVRYSYDGMGRLTERLHLGELPNVGDPDSARPFIERRDYVWENQSLAAEIGYNDPAGTQVRWRKVYVPGPGGLDDPTQVIVENGSGVRNLYTFLRDEQLSVVGIVAEDETADPAVPVVPVRYKYTPFGEAFVESSPQMELAEFDAAVDDVGGASQTVGGSAVGGSLVVRFGMPLDAATLAGGVVLERDSGAGFGAVPGAEWVADLDDGLNLRAMVLAGWERGVSYRLRLLGGLRDVLGRAPPVSNSEVEFAVPAGATGVVFEQRFPVHFDSSVASTDALAGRFPGGQNRLFHGGWTDPVTGLVYFRARWYDAGSGAFLSEDPLGDVDSPNLYQYARNSAFNFSDPMGLQAGADPELRKILNMVQQAADAAAQSHGVNNRVEAFFAGDKGTAIHKTMQELLSPGGKYYHPRIATEVAVSERGTIVEFGAKSTKRGTLVKDVVILKRGHTIDDISRFSTKASDVTGLVADLKIGKKGATMRQADTLRRFGVTNVKIGAFGDLADAVPGGLTRLKWAKRVRGLPLLSALLLGVTLDEARAAADDGDLDRALAVMTGLDIVEDGVKAVGNTLESEIRDQAESLGIAGEQRGEIGRENN